MKNRSVPAEVLLPHLVYDDVDEAITWLTKVFGFVERYRYGAPDGAQMHLGDAWIMLTRTREGRETPKQAGHATQFLTVFVEDVDAHYARARAEGAQIIEEPHETVYGEWQYAVEDFAGHRWM